MYLIPSLPRVQELGWIRSCLGYMTVWVLGECFSLCASRSPTWRGRHTQERPLPRVSAQTRALVPGTHAKSSWSGGAGSAAVWWSATGTGFQTRVIRCGSELWKFSQLPLGKSVFSERRLMIIPVPQECCEALFLTNCALGPLWDF